MADDGSPRSEAWLQARIALSDLSRRLVADGERRAMLALLDHQRSEGLPLLPAGIGAPGLGGRPEFELALQSALSQGEASWRALIEDRSEIERAHLYGSSWRFYDETHHVLGQSAHPEAAAELARRRDACLGDTLVSVVLCLDDDREAAWALASVLGQTHARLEVVLIDGGGTSREFLTVATSDPRVRVVAKPPEEPCPARDLGLREARGAYIAFISAAAEWAPDKLELQLEAMSKAGAVASHTRYRLNGVLAAEGSPIHPDTLMIHRSLTAAGFRFAAGGRSAGVAPWTPLAEHGHLLKIDAPLCGLKGTVVAI